MSKSDIYPGETLVSPALFMTTNEVMCRLHRRHSAIIKISNDGKTYSNETWTHIVHNSICHDCTVDENTFVASCSRKVLVVV